ncbi:MAG: hypothetical protein JJE13_11580 [Thermoleophilia bacterium]|nr:hypothetical protein [Thermoleophilia bacterium]
MGAPEANVRVSELLGQGNVVGAEDELKNATVLLHQAIDGQKRNAVSSPGMAVEQVIAQIDAEVQQFLACAFPLIEYGNDRSHQIVVACLDRIVSVARQETTAPGWWQTITAIAVRLTWTVGAFAVALGRIDFLVCLPFISIKPSVGWGNESMLDAKSARVLQAFESSPLASFNSHSEWISELDLFEQRYPHLQLDEYLSTALAEFDVLVAARQAQGGQRSGFYCAGADRDDRIVEDRILARLRISPQRKSIARFVGAEPAELGTELNRIYGLFKFGPHTWGDTKSLFPNTDL